MVTRRARRGGAVAAAIAFAFQPGVPASAADAADDGTERARSPSHETGEVVVEGLRPAPQPEDPTSFTRVVEVDDYAGEDKRVEDLIETVPGVHVRRFGGPGAPSEISIRGSSSSQVVVLLDGVRLNSAQTGAVDLSTVPLDLLERIEVTRGGGSVETGSDAIGGVVNLVTKRPSARPETRVAGGFGSFDTWQGSLSQTGRVGGLEALLGYDAFKTSGDWRFEPIDVPGDDDDSVERINNRSERHAGSFKLARDVGERLRLELSDQLFHSEEGRPGLDQAAGGENRGQSPVGRARRTRNVVQLHALAAAPSPLALDADLRLFHRYDRRVFQDDFRTPVVDSDDRNAAYGGRARVAGETSLLSARLRPSLGVELRRDEHDPKETGFEARRVFGLFLQSEIALFDERLRLVPALRLDDTEGFDTEWIPRLGLVASPWPWLELRANAERSYRVPTYDELFLDEFSLRGNPGLEPEEAVNLDAGVRLGLEGPGFPRRVLLEVVGFANEIDETIVFQPVSPEVVAATNIPDVRTRGVEVYGRLDPFAWLRVSGSWTLLDSEIRRNDSPLPGRPEHEYDVRVELLPWDGLVKWVGEMLHVGELPLVEGGDRTLSAQTSFDTSVTLELHRLVGLDERLGLSALRLSATATNVSDRALRDAQFFPKPGRVIGFRLEARR